MGQVQSGEEHIAIARFVSELTEDMVTVRLEDASATVSVGQVIHVDQVPGSDEMVVGSVLNANNVDSIMVMLDRTAYVGQVVVSQEDRQLAERNPLVDDPMFIRPGQ